jgi:hypothetical protein
MCNPSDSPPECTESLMGSGAHTPWQIWGLTVAYTFALDHRLGRQIPHLLRSWNVMLAGRRSRACRSPGQRLAILTFRAYLISVAARLPHPSLARIFREAGIMEQLNKVSKQVSKVSEQGEYASE